MLLISALWLTGCGNPELSLDHVCEEAAFAAASRTYACVGDAEASQSARDLVDGLTCRLEGMERGTTADLYETRFYDCVRAMYSLDCRIVEAGYESEDTWLDASEFCDYVFIEAETDSDTDLPWLVLEQEQTQ